MEISKKANTKKLNFERGEIKSEKQIQLILVLELHVTCKLNVINL